MLDQFKQALEFDYQTNERAILFLKTGVIKRLDSPVVTFRDYITLKKSAFLAVEVVGIDVEDNTHLVVDFGKSATITNDNGFQVECNGLWKLPIDCLAYVINIPYGEGHMEGLELLQENISVDLLYDYTDKFIDIHGYPPHRFSVKPEALEKMLEDEDHIKALCEFACLDAIDVGKVPYATSVYLSSEMIPQIFQLDYLIPEEV